MSKKPRSKDDEWIKAKRRKAAAQQNWRCYWCQQLMCEIQNCPHQATLDHLIPKHQGGTLKPGNYVAACRKCNSERHPDLNRTKGNGALFATSGEVHTSPFEKLKGLFHEEANPTVRSAD
jgi:HNH endonuclease